jgi:hypothetical protein
MVKKGVLRLPAVILSTILNLMLCVPFGLSIFPASWVSTFNFIPRICFLRQLNFSSLLS